MKALPIVYNAWFIGQTLYLFRLVSFSYINLIIIKSNIIMITRSNILSSFISLPLFIQNPYLRVVIDYSDLKQALPLVGNGDLLYS